MNQPSCQSDGSETRYRLLFDEAHDIILFVRAADGRIVEANTAAETGYGYSREELLELRMDGLSVAEEPAFAGQVKAAGAGGFSFVTEHRRKAGTTFFVEVSLGGSTTVDGESVLLAVIRDVSERKRAEHQLAASEQALRQAVEFSPVPMLITTGVDERMLLINRKFTEVFGYGPRQLKTATDWWPLAYPDEEYRRQLKEQWIERISKAIEDHTTIEPMNANVTCADGSVRYVEGHFGHIGPVDIVTLVDMTECKLAEEALRHQAAALEDANTALRVILAQRNRECIELEQTIVSNAETIVMPMLEKLKKNLAKGPEAIYLDAAIQTLKDLVLPMATSFEAAAGPRVQLTRREREIAVLIRAGKSSGEIAEALYISPATVTFHRKNLRRKFGLGPQGPSLAAYLARLPWSEQERGGGRVAEGG